MDGMQRISTYRLILLGILLCGIAAESRLTSTRAHLRLTGVLSQFPTRIEDFQGVDEPNSYTEAVRRMYWPAAVVDRSYSKGTSEPIQVFISPDIVGAHPQDICAQYAGWKVLKETAADLPGTPSVKLTRTVEATPSIPGYPAAILACDQYWREDQRGLSREQSKDFFNRRSFCFRVLICTQIPDLPGADDAFTRLDAFATSADPIVCQFLRKAEAE